MEAGDRTARDRHEEQCDHRLHVIRQRRVDRRRHHSGVREQNRDEEDAEPDEELEAVDVVARLKQ